MAIYMGMLPELATAMLAYARIGAPHTVAFGGFPSNALADRIRDCQARIVITQDAGWRRGRELKRKAIVDESVASCPTIEKILVYQRTGSPVSMSIRKSGCGVPGADRARALSYCRYLVADGNRHDHDCPLARSDSDQTRFCDAALADVVTRDGTPVPAGSGGCLVITKPWPGMLSTLDGDPDRYVSEYWSQIPGLDFAGDGARKDEDGYFWVMGGIDDVMNVSGHRLSSAELESALVSHDKVAEAAVVAHPDERKGEAPCAFVVLQAGVTPIAALENELKGWVAMEIGLLAKPDVIRFVAGLPKTSSGKIMRRLLRGIVTDGGVSGDTTTLEDLSVLAQLRPTDSEERADSPLTRGGGSGVAAGDPRCG